MKIKFRVLSLLMLLVLLLGSSLNPVEASAATKETKKKVTDTDYKNAVKSLKEIFQYDIYGRGSEEFTIEGFKFIDLNADKMPEMLMKTDCGVMAFVYSFDNGKYEDLYFISNFNETLYHNKNKNILINYSNSDGTKLWRIAEIHLYSEYQWEYFGSASVYYRQSDGKGELTKGNYFNDYSDEEKKISKSKLEKETKACLKGAEEIKITIKNTKSNRNKYFKDVATFKSAVVNAKSSNKK